jgi:hypothetical protein
MAPKVVSEPVVQVCVTVNLICLSVRFSTWIGVCEKLVHVSLLPSTTSISLSFLSSHTVGAAEGSRLGKPLGVLLGMPVGLFEGASMG